MKVLVVVDEVSVVLVVDVVVLVVVVDVVGVGNEIDSGTTMS